MNTDLNVCSGHGNCTAPETCNCETKYGGTNCQTPKCFGILSTSSSVCESSGTCTAPNTCECEEANSGEQCELLFEASLDDSFNNILDGDESIDIPFMFNQFTIYARVRSSLQQMEYNLNYDWNIEGENSLDEEPIISNNGEVFTIKSGSFPEPNTEYTLTINVEINNNEHKSLKQSVKLNVGNDDNSSNINYSSHLSTCYSFILILISFITFLI
jgi:hypothetical protein